MMDPLLAMFLDIPIIINLCLRHLIKLSDFQPGEHPLIHSDRGFQYTSNGFKRRIDKAKMTQSMSRVGTMY